MKRLLFCLFFTALALCAVDLPLDLAEWDGNPLAWSRHDDAIRTAHFGGSLEYTAAPCSETATVEAVLTVRKRENLSFAIAGTGLVMDANNYYHLALVEAPVSAGARHFCELNQCWHEAWPYRDNLVLAVSEGDGQWEYNVPYRIRLSKSPAGIDGLVENATTGRLVFHRSYTFKDGTCVRFVRPALRGNNIIADFTRLSGRWSGAVLDAKPSFPPYASDSFVPGRTTTPTGFFQVKQDPADGSWWSYDPLGRGYVVFCMGSVRYHGHACERLGGRRLYEEHNRKSYPSRLAWEEETLARLKAWGFNSFNGDRVLNQRGLAHQTFLSIGMNFTAFGGDCEIAPYEFRPCSAFPNVYHPQFAAYCAWRLRQLCSHDVNNPWLYGYFTDNELAWWGRGAADTGLFDLTMAKPAAHTAKQAACDLLWQQAGQNLDTLNRVWSLSLTDRSQLLALTKLPSATADQRAVKLAFLRQTAERYFRTIHDAFRAIDPHHLLLGCRCAGLDRNHPVVWEMMGRYSDVITWNSYVPVDLETGVVYADWKSPSRPLRDSFEPIVEVAKKPVLITEWSYPALDSGLPCTHGAGMRVLTQKDRAEASAIYMKTLLSMPFVLGYNAFMWVDQPPLGISAAFPECTNYGIVSSDGVPYQPLVDAYTEIQREPAKYKNRPLPPPRPVQTPDFALHKQLLVPPLQDTPANPAFTFSQTAPGIFTAANGRYRLFRDDSAPLIRLERDGQPLGELAVMLMHTPADGKARWEQASKFVSAQLAADHDRLIITLTTRNVPATPQDPAFSIDWRIVLLPQSDWFLWELTAVHNLGTVPLNINRLYLRGYPLFTGKRDSSDDVTFRSVPNLRAPIAFAGWTSSDTKRFFAFAGDSHRPLSLRCWQDTQRGTWHPDLCYFLAASLAPQASVKPPTPFVLLAFGGDGPLRDALPTALKLWR